PPYTLIIPPVQDAVHLRTLHSCPTRRSSDLEDSHHEYHPLMADSKSLATAIRMLMATITKGYALNQCVFPIPHSYLIIINPIQPDRKSTRLNSSHVSISYAVFCLKKKN